MKKKIKRIALTTLTLIILLGISSCIFLQHPKFGNIPSGKRLETISKSPNYKEGKFQNYSPTPTFAQGYGFWGELRKQLFGKFPHTVPNNAIPAIKQDLLNLPIDSNVLVWFGHSSCFVQIEGKRILIDPVFSPNASPVSGSIKAFKGTNIYSVADLPEIDYLLISHDHYDHLDYQTALDLKDKVKFVICGLGIGAHFERWGYPADKIIEKDWNESVDVDSGFTIHTLPARHKTGRKLQENRAMWLSFLIETKKRKIFYSGDTGYDEHFKTIGKQFGTIDWALMENGQYDSAWHYVHLLPEETLKAAKDLNARNIIPVHNAKFALGKHPWDEPMVKLTELNKKYQLTIATPMIGELVNLDDNNQHFKHWWEEIE